MTQARLALPELPFALTPLERWSADEVWFAAELDGVTERLMLTDRELERLAGHLADIVAGKRSATEFLSEDEQLELGVARAGRGFRVRIVVRSAEDAAAPTTAGELTPAQLRRVATDLRALSA